jgi:hypothetical protein
VRTLEDAGGNTDVKAQGQRFQWVTRLADAADAVFLSSWAGGVERGVWSAEHGARSTERERGSVALRGKFAEGGIGGQKAVGRGQELMPGARPLELHDGRLEGQDEVGGRQAMRDDAP